MSNKLITKWITEKQAAKLSKISSVWNRMLQIGVFMNRGYDISESNSCMVAEAHEFDGKYKGCMSCQSFGNLFAMYSPYGIRNPKLFRTKLTQFIKHFEADHMELKKK